MASQISLDSFPPEIIQRVASFSSCESVLALIKVNRYLHQTCYDNAVFRTVIRNGNGYGIVKAWDCDLISDSTSTSDLARLALADSHARAWLANIEPSLDKGQQISDEKQSKKQHQSVQFEDDMMWDPILKWAPQLVALNHPFTTEEDHLKEIVDKFQNMRIFYFRDPATISFCITSIVLYHCTAALQHGSSAGPKLLEYLRQQLGSETSAFTLPTNLICSLLVNAHMVLREISLPSPYKIPFRDLLHVPIPFSTKGFTGFSHLSVMTSTSFLESGEWVGYYSYRMNTTRTRWDPPMKGIRFTADPDVGPFALKASGTDNVGAFTLEGTVDDHGEVEMRKSYNSQGFFWDWNASMTPFGIVGTWGRGRNPHGHFWLWKREWSQW